MNELLPNETRAALSAFVTARLGLRFPPDRWGELEEGVRAACRELGVADVPRWVRGLLVGLPTFAQLQTLANQLTVGETYFFRQGEVFRILGQEIIPRLAEKRRSTVGRRLHLWSAACSTGEEPYSLAILLRDMLPDLPEWRVSILGTDINTRALARAGQATYTNWSFRDTPPGLRERYFRPQPRNLFQLVPPVRDMVRFAYLNLVEDAYPVRPGGFDIIFCRNALMYFSAEWQELILHRLGHALSADGYLVVGPCDTHPLLTQQFQPSGACPTIYRKRSLAPTAVAASFAGGAPEVRSDAPAAPAFELEVPRRAPPPEVAPAEPPEAPAPVLAPETAAEAEFERARSQANDGALAEALQHCDRALAHDRLNPSIHYLRACVLQELNNRSEAIAAHHRVLFLDPQFVLSHLALGSLWRQAGEPELARRAFAAANQVLQRFNQGDAVPGADGLTAGRLRAVASAELAAIGVN